MSRFPSTYVTTDIVAFRQVAMGRLEILFIQRKNPPFQGAWALPGGFFDQNLQFGAARELPPGYGM